MLKSCVQKTMKAEAAGKIGRMVRGVGEAGTVAGNGTRPLYRLQSCRWRRLLLFSCPKQVTRRRGGEEGSRTLVPRVVARCGPKCGRVDNTAHGYSSCCSCSYYCSCCCCYCCHRPGECTLDMQTRQRWGPEL